MDALSYKYTLTSELSETIMARIIQRWYIVIILLPIAVNIFTNTVTWETLKDNPIITVLVLSIIVNIILTGEFILFASRNKNDDFQNDKRILSDLIATLNLEDNEMILRLTNHVDILEYRYVKDIDNFLDKAERLENYVKNKRLNKILSIFRKSLYEYLGYLRRFMVTHAEADFKTLSIPLDLKDINYDLYMERVDKLDKSANTAYRDLKVLMIELRKQNII